MRVTAPRIAAHKNRIISRLGPYSKLGALAKLDGRSTEAKFMQRLRDELIEHVGGAPSVVQRAMIERAARLSLLLETTR